MTLVVLVHGAANSSGVWRRWRGGLEALGWQTLAVDLRGHGAAPPVDLSRVRMQDYADDVASAALATSGGAPFVVMGWSMGGLVAMQVAARGLAAACVALAPSTPAIREDPSVPLRAGDFGAEEYGITSLDPANQPTMPDLDPEARQIALACLCRESRYARDERKRGIVISSMPCPVLIVTGTLESDRRPSAYAHLPFPADHQEIEGATHWGLVLSQTALHQAIPSVSHWLQQKVVAPIPHTPSSAQYPR